MKFQIVNSSICTLHLWTYSLTSHSISIGNREIRSIFIEYVLWRPMAYCSTHHHRRVIGAAQCTVHIILLCLNHFTHTSSIHILGEFDFGSDFELVSPFDKSACCNIFRLLIPCLRSSDGKSLLADSIGFTYIRTCHHCQQVMNVCIRISHTSKISRTMFAKLDAPIEKKDLIGISNDQIGITAGSHFLRSMRIWQLKMFYNSQVASWNILNSPFFVFVLAWIDSTNSICLEI